MTDAEIIAEIRKKRELWDGNHPLHNNKQVTAASWRDIKEELDVNVGDLKEVWHDSQKRYRQELTKNVEHVEKYGTKRYSNWANYDRMNFMKREVLGASGSLQKRRELNAIARRRNDQNVVCKKEVTATVRYREEYRYDSD